MPALERRSRTSFLLLRLSSSARVGSRSAAPAPRAEPAIAQNVRVVRSLRSSATTRRVTCPASVPLVSSRKTLSSDWRGRYSSNTAMPFSSAVVPTSSSDAPRTASHPPAASPGSAVDAVPGAERACSRSASALRTHTGASTPDVSSSSEPCATSRPRLITTTSSTVCAISASTWLDTSTVRPAAACARRKSRSQRIPCGSSPLAGSSSTSARGSPSSAAREAQPLAHPERVAPSRACRRRRPAPRAGAPRPRACAAGPRRWRARAGGCARCARDGTAAPRAPRPPP